MFGKYDTKSLCKDENDTENWSFPSNYERFSTVNVPKSRLGKRRTIDTSSGVKRDLLKGLSSASGNNGLKIDKEALQSTCSQGPSLTHPVNTYLTPTHKKIDSLSLNKHSQEPSTECKYLNRNAGSLTPFRKENSKPLKEINNLIIDQKLNVDPGKPPPGKQLPVSLQDENDTSDIRKVLNKSFEVSDSTNTCTTENISFQPSLSTTENQVDSSHSDIGNNSSFMTAHDIYNIDRSRSHQDSLYLKTPRQQGFSVLDMLDSPLDPLDSLPGYSENDNFRNILTKTPGLSHFEPFKTPFKCQTRSDRFGSEVFTPTLINNGKTPLLKKNNVAEHDLKSNNKISPSDSKAAQVGVTLSNQLHITNTNSFLKTTPPSEEYRKYNDSSSESTKPSPSFEIKVKKQIFEGLGWSLPPPSFTIESPIVKSQEKEPDPVPLTAESSSSDPSENDNHPSINVSEMEVDYNSTQSVLQSHSETIEEYSVMPDQTNTNDLPETKQSCHLDYSECNKTTTNTKKNLCDSYNPYRNNHTAYEIETSYGNDNTMDTTDNKTSICNSSITSVKSSSTCVNSFDTSCDKLKLNSTPRDTNAAIEQSIKVPNIRPEESPKPIIQAVESLSDKFDNVTVVARQPEVNPPVKPIVTRPPEVVAIEVPKVEQIPHPVPSVTNDNHQFVAPHQPAIGYRQQVSKPQTNVIYVNKKPYTVLSILGRGGSSEVYQVLEAESSKSMAMKFVNLVSVEDSIATGYLNEIGVLAKLQGCPSVIKMFDSEYIPESKILYVVMEKGDTDFSRLMKDIMKTKKISMSMIMYYWTEMLSCVKDIHERGIIHSDLKPANFLLVSGRLKLIDFGIASSLQGDMTSVLKDVTTGTFNYMSPEAIRNCGETKGYKITYKSDIWSLGCILYNLLYGRTPFAHLVNTWAKLSAIADPKTEVTFPSNSAAPPNLLFSVRWALTKDPKERPTAEELLKLAELTPGPDTRLGRQISSLLTEYMLQTFPNCKVQLEPQKKEDKH